MSQAGHECVGACEIDKYARSVYARHFPKVRLWEDATKINPKELPDFECLCAGFPCQAFSIAGQRRGFEDTRGSLFFEIARIAKEKRPRYLLLENVKGLLNHDSGKTFRVIISTLDEMGYDAEWQVLNSKYFVPQNRERVFIIGHLRGTSGRKIFPLGEINKKSTSSQRETQKEKQHRHNQNSSTLTSNYWKGWGSSRQLIAEPKLQQLNNTPHDTGRIYHPNGIARSLRANSGGMGSKTGLYAVTKDHGRLRETKDESLAIDANYWKGPDNHGQRTMIYMAHSKGNIKQRIQDRENVWTITENARDFGVLEPSIVADRSRKYAGKGRNMESPKEISNSLTSVCKDNYLLRDTRIRRLTPKECERLQGFEDSWTLFGKDGEEISDTQRYRMCGNAITVPVVKYVAENLS